MESVDQIVATSERSTITLPSEHISHLGLAAGDFVRTFHVAEGLLMTPCDPVVSEQLKVARRVMQDHADVLRRLAKS